MWKRLGCSLCWPPAHRPGCSRRGSVLGCVCAGILLLLVWGKQGIKDLLPMAMLLSNTYGVPSVLVPTRLH